MIKEMPSHGISSFSSIKSFINVTEVKKSDSLNSYLMLNPKGPNFLLSISNEWKKLNEKTIFFQVSGLEDSKMLEFS